jgi:hypothetical protein
MTANYAELVSAYKPSGMAINGTDLPEDSGVLMTGVNQSTSL